MSVQKARQGYKLVKSLYGKYEEFPEEWEKHEIKQLVDSIKSGVSRLLSPLDIGYLVFTSGNIQDGKFDTSDKKFWHMDDTQGVDLKQYILEDNDILLNFINSVERIGKSCLFKKQDRDWIYSTNQFRIKTKTSKVSNEFFDYLLKSTLIQKQIQGITQPAINQASFSKHFFEQIFIILPPIQEQQKIASILSNVDSLINQTQKIIEQTQKLKKGLMQRLLTRGIGHTKFKKTQFGEIPEEWEIKQLQELGKIERGKFMHRPRNEPRFYGGNYPFIQTGDVEKSNGLIKEYSQTLNEEGLKISKLFPSDIIVITIAANIGSTAITTFPTCFPDSLVGISCEAINVRFLHYFLKTRKQFLNNLATNSAQKNINLETLRPLLIPIPPQTEQQKIATILNTVDSKITDLESKKSILQKLKKGLMQKLLTGQIRVKV